MTDEHKKFEQACEQIRIENAALLEEFMAWMFKQRASERTCRMHLSNVTFFIQEFLLYEEPLRPQEGTSSLGMYFGSWFIRKAAWSSPGNVKTNATSVVKFYSFLVDKGLISADALAKIRLRVKTELPQWMERARRYS